MKTAISLPDPLFKAVDRTAKRLGISRSELFARAVASYLENAAEVTAALDRVYRDEPGTVDPTLARLQRRAVTREDW
jgi:metal-responsive CopG/Arc/MetJ family transcriptional regulator